MISFVLYIASRKILGFGDIFGIVLGKCVLASIKLSQCPRLPFHRLFPLPVD